MKRKLVVLLFATSGLVLTNLACTKSISGKVGSDKTVVTFQNEPGEPLAKVGDVTLSVEGLSRDFLARQGRFRGAPHLNTDKKRIDYVENQVIQEAMFQEAVKLGYFNDPEIKRDIKKIVVQKLVRDRLSAAQEKYEPTEEEIKEHYNNNLNLYDRDEAVKVSYLRIPFGNDRQKAKEIATMIQRDAAKNVQKANTKRFAQLAIKYAKMPGTPGGVRIENGNGTYMEREPFENMFGKNSFETVKKMANIGEISPLITHKDSYTIIMKTGYRKKLNETMSEATPKIKKRLAFENRGQTYENYMAKLKKDYNIEIYRERIADLGKDTTIGGIQAQENVASNE